MRAVLLAAVLVALAVSVRAETITRCGASSGQGWFFAGPTTPQGEVGWHQDTVSKGFLLIVDGDKPDIVYSDTAGPRSSRADGASVMFVPGTNSGFKLVLLVYQAAGTVEHYLFQLDRAGNGSVAWGTARGSSLVLNSSLFVAKCRAP